MVNRLFILVLQFRLPLGQWFADAIDWLSITFSSQFGSIRSAIQWLIEEIAFVLTLSPYWLTAFALAVLAWFVSGRGVALLSLVGILVIYNIGLWPATVVTMSLIITSTLIALALGVPLGILAAKFPTVDLVLHPILDFMQTMPAFVYLIPAVFFFRIGAVPAVFATIIFAMPPAIRLTSLGLRQVPKS